MSRILAAHFQLQDEIEQARVALLEAGFPADQISTFYVNQPGQHHQIPTGGDRDASPGAKETPQGVAQGMAAGGAVGAAIGAATAVVTGPVGPAVGALVGAHIGSLYSFSDMKPAGAAEEGGENRDQPRQAGMLIAVALGVDSDYQRALEVLRGRGGERIEVADGTIRDGDWSDFDPLAPPRLVS